MYTTSRVVNLVFGALGPKTPIFSALICKPATRFIQKAIKTLNPRDDIFIVCFYLKKYTNGTFQGLILIFGAPGQILGPFLDFFSFTIRSRSIETVQI